MVSYPPELVQLLKTHAPLISGSAEELSIRVASIVAVERVRLEILRLRAEEEESCAEADAVSSVMIDFYLWDLAKRVENRPEGVDGVETNAMLPTHRTRSIWY